MASVAYLADVLMQEAGKSSPDVRLRIEEKIGEVTLEILQQSEGRFKKLARTQNISILVGVKEYLLPADYFTAKREFIEIDSNSDFVRRVYVVSEMEVYTRIEAESNLSVSYCWIDFNETGYGTTGRGYYLHLAVDPTETAIYRFAYYRQPTENDAEAIDSFTLIKRGVRGNLPDLFPKTAQVDISIYANSLGRSGEDPSQHTTETVVHPGRRRGRLNALLHRIGSGS
jgi:hypothetical protein